MAPARAGSRVSALPCKEGREARERRRVRQAVTRFQGNLSHAAAAWGLSRPTLYELVEKLGIEKGDLDRQV